MSSRAKRGDLPRIGKIASSLVALAPRNDVKENMKLKKDFLSITDLTAKEIWQVLSLAKKIKHSHLDSCKDKTMVMLFEKPSLRTKLSFDVAFNQLGGHTVFFGPDEVGLGKREAISDVAKVTSSMADLIVARVFSHQQLTELANNSKIPVINALSDLEHPCQALADFLTIWEIKGKLKGLTLAFIGDGENNVARSLALGCAILGINFKCASPIGKYTDSPKEAIKNADIVYTDTWVSMGDEAEKDKRLKVFKNYQVNQKLMALAKKDAIFMHDMPAYRGKEVSAEVIDGKQSVMFQQAENRLHTQKALISYLLGCQPKIEMSPFKCLKMNGFIYYFVIARRESSTDVAIYHRGRLLH